MVKETLYNQAVGVSEEYLGPAGERFIDRQIITHLRIKPEALKKTDLPQLVKWASLAFAVLTKDSNEVNGFKKDLLSLGKTKVA